MPRLGHFSSRALNGIGLRPPVTIILNSNFDQSSVGTITDSSVSGFTFSTNPTTPTIDTTIKKFGASSIKFTPNNVEATLQCVDSQTAGAAYSLAGVDATIEMWIYINQSTYQWLDLFWWSNTLIRLNGPIGSASFSLAVSRVADPYAWNPISLSGGGGLVINTDEWIHIALVKKESPTRKITMYCNGIYAGESAIGSTLDIIPNGPRPMGFGGGAGAGYLQPTSFNIDSIRITKGAALYTSGFQVPSTAFY